MDVEFLKFIKNSAKTLQKILKDNKKFQIFFDSDVDGLMSLLITLKSLKKLGKDVKFEEVKDREDLPKIIENLKDKNYVYIFLDLGLKEEYLEKIRKLQIKVIWIDHHQIETFSTKGIIYINPLVVDKNLYIPTSAITYLIFEKIVYIKENLYYSAIGIIADKGQKSCEKIIKLASIKFKESYENFELIAQKVNSLFILNKKIKRYVNKMQNIKFFKSKELERIYKKVQKEIEKELKNFEKKKIETKNVVIYEIKSKLKIRSTIASILSEKIKDKIIVIYQKEKDKVKISLRTSLENVNLLEILKKTKIDFISFGGHKKACGAVIRKKDLNKLINQIKRWSK